MRMVARPHFSHHSWVEWDDWQLQRSRHCGER